MPRPGSLHKYLSLTIHGKSPKENIILKDFMMFMCGSLKAIAESFQLPIAKGDFPHHFHTNHNQYYIGPLPPIDSPEDYFCLLQKKDPKEVEEIHHWYTQQCQIFCTCTVLPCTCSKRPWNLQEQLIEYCWLDVDVLAGIIERFRKAHLEFGEHADTIEGWKPTSIDPFHFHTQSQVAMNFFLAGHASDKTCAISSIKYRKNWSKISLIWLDSISHSQNIHIQHIGNSNKEYFDIHTDRYVDGYCEETNTIYQFHGCYFHGCPKCYPNQQDIHPQKRISYETIYQNTIQHLQILQQHYNVVIMWECDFRQQHQLTPYEKELQNIILDRDEIFYGGRTEVFSPYCNETETDKIEYHDVCSLYPTVCSHDLLPTGVPTRYFGKEAEQQRHRLHPSHPQAIFGYIRCRIRPSSNDILGLLPAKRDGKLVFDVEEKVGAWFSREIYLAMSQGYQVLDIYEILDFDENNRSNKFFKGYMSFFLRMKQEAEGWKKAGASSETPSNEEQQQCITTLYELNGQMARMRPDRVSKNDVRRQTAKIYLNCLWGKFGQSPQRDEQYIIYGYHQFLKINYNPEIQSKSIRYRHIRGEAYQVTYNKQKENYQRNPRYNVWIAAAVTANARCRLHEQMIKIGPERVLYCDTDSNIFLYPRHLPSLASRGLGNWVDETKDMGSPIQKLFAFAPKKYCLQLHGEHYYKVKAKGCRMTIPNKEKANPQTLERILQLKCIELAQGYEPQSPLLLDHFTIFSNALNSEYPYGEMFSRYSKKKFQAIITKRQLQPLLQPHDIIEDQEEFLRTHPLSLYGRIHTLPFGYNLIPSEQPSLDSFG